MGNTDRNLIVEIENVVPEKVVLSIKDELLITEDIDTEIDQAAYRFGYFAVLAEKAKHRAEKFKMALEFMESELIKEISESREAECKKALTVDQMKATVRSQTKYKNLRYQVHIAAEQSDILFQVAKAFERKSNLIQTKAANRRREHEGAN